MPGLHENIKTSDKNDLKHSAIGARNLRVQLSGKKLPLKLHMREFEGDFSFDGAGAAYRLHCVSHHEVWRRHMCCKMTDEPRTMSTVFPYYLSLHRTNLDGYEILSVNKKRKVSFS